MKKLAFVVTHDLHEDGRLFLSNRKELSLLIRELSAFYDITLILRKIRKKSMKRLAAIYLFFMMMQFPHASFLMLQAAHIIRSKAGNQRRYYPEAGTV